MLFFWIAAIGGSVMFFVMTYHTEYPLWSAGAADKLARAP